MIYMDNAATTRVLPEVVEAMLPYYTEQYGNPSSIYRFAQQSRKVVDEARRTIAQSIGASPQELFFTSCGTESDNWAILSIAQAYRSKGNHIITSKIEHHAVLHTCEYLEKNGFDVTYLDVDESGLVNPDDLRAAIRPDTTLITIMFANNEIGTIQPVQEIGAIAKEHGILFHTDAVQAYGHLPIDVQTLPVDLMSASAHKLNGPKGVGFLYVRKGIRLQPYLHGGAQERGKRGGTENVASIVGFAKAVEIAFATLSERHEKEVLLRDHLVKRITGEIDHVRYNGHATQRLSGNANFSFRFIEGEALLIWLDMANICASSGSACTSGSLDPSHVLLAIGLPHEIAHGSLRLSLSADNTMEDVDYVVDELKKIVTKLRNMSPLYEDFLKD